MRNRVWGAGIVCIILAIFARRLIRVKVQQYGTIRALENGRSAFGKHRVAPQVVHAHASSGAPASPVVAHAPPITTHADEVRGDPVTAPDSIPTDVGTEGQAQVAYDAEALLGFYQKMVEIRLFEDATTKAFRQGKIGGYLHVYSGQEAVAIGFINAIDRDKDDRVITAYRDHAHAILCGADPKQVMAELYGKGTGIVGGKGGSMHLFYTDGGMYGGYGIVAGHIPLGPGMAYGLKHQGKDSVVQLYFGDGSMHNGAFHEAANLAGLWGKDELCPCLFILENNQYGMGTSVERATAMTELGKKFEGYGIEWEQVDGMDLEACLEVADRAMQRVRETGKPYGIEALNYRIVPHGAADFLEKYRSKEEVAKWREKDPIVTLHQRLLDLGIEESRMEDIRAEAKAKADEAVKFAEESPDPDLDTLLTDVYAEGVEVQPAG